jgi:glycerophosphoryl diester phosphodiesterase
MVTKIGHRGAMGYISENTLSSFEKSIKIGVDVIELDVRLCKTGQLVIIHDEKVDRTTNSKGYVAEKTLEELKALNTGNGEEIPTLYESLSFIDRRVKVNIELKGVGTARPVYKTIQDFIKNKNWKKSDFLISSFDHSQLEEFHLLDSNIRIGVLIRNNPMGYDQFLKKINAYSVNISLKLINQELVDYFHKKNLKVYVWVVNKLSDIKQMKLLGVDGFFSDFPDKIN